MPYKSFTQNEHFKFSYLAKITLSIEEEKVQKSLAGVNLIRII